MRACPNKALYYCRDKYDRNKSLANAQEYIDRLESYIPNEIIDQYVYEDSFRKILSLIEETFRPDHFNSAFQEKHGELVHWLDLDFMNWLDDHQQELKRQLSWSQVCQLQCNYNGWRLNKTLGDIPEKTIRGMWGYTDEKQNEEFLQIINQRK